jgi:hypothetical protein
MTLHPISLNGENIIFIFISVHLHCPVSGLPGFIIALALLDRATGKLRFKGNISFPELGVFILQQNWLILKYNIHHCLFCRPSCCIVQGCLDEPIGLLQSLGWLTNI